MRRTLGSFLFLGCIACVDSGQGSPQDAGVRDSVGIKVITASVSDRIYARLSTVPVLSIGVIEGPEALMFSNVKSAAWNADGNLVIADFGSGQIRTFSSEGELMRTVGRQGEGPGEFLALSGAWPGVDGDVVAMDERLRRITEFGPSGEVVRVSRLEGVADAGMLRPRGPGGTRSVFSSITTAAQLSDGATIRPPVLFVRHRLDGTMLDTVAQVPGYASTAKNVNGNLQVLFVPLSSGPTATATGDGIAITGGDLYEVRFFDTNGSLSRIIRLSESPPALADHHMDAWLNAMAGENADADTKRRTRERYEGVSLPATLPAYTDLVVADRGDLWARRYSLLGAATARWDVFGADGRYEGRVDLQATLRVMAVTDSQLLGIDRDALGVERVQVWKVTAAEGAGQVLPGPGGPVEFIGLERWNAEELYDAIQEVDPERPFHACAAIMKQQLGFADAAAILYVGYGRDPYTVVVGVDDSSRVRYRPAGRETVVLPDTWLKLKGLAGGDVRTLQAAARTLPLRGGVFGFLNGARRRAKGMGADPKTLDELWDLVDRADREEDRRLAHDILARDSAWSARAAATLVLGNFMDDDSAWHPLVRSLIDSDGKVAAVADNMLQGLMERKTDPVDWSGARAYLSVLFGGTRPSTFRRILEVLVATDIDPAFGQQLVRENPDLLLAFAGAQHEPTRESAIAFLRAVSGEDYGVDVEAWRVWARRGPSREASQPRIPAEPSSGSDRR